MILAVYRTRRTAEQVEREVRTFCHLPSHMRRARPASPQALGVEVPRWVDTARVKRLGWFKWAVVGFAQSETNA